MAFGSNILPNNAAFYTLNNASIIGGVLSIGLNGSATLLINESLLGTFPGSFKFNLASNLYNNINAPEIFCTFNITTAEGGETICITPSQEKSTDIFSTTVTTTVTDYVFCTLTITSSRPCEITLWEMCPEIDGDISTIIDGVTQSLPKLLYDYNEVETQVAQEKTLIGIITSRLQQATDLQGHLLVNCVLSEYSSVYITLRDEDTDELYSPVKFTLQAGQNTITIPHSYLKRQAGLHSFRAYMQVTNGTATIPVRGVLYTIDGGYLAEALDDLALQILDFTIMQTVPSAGPEKIWCCGTKVTDGVENLIIQSSRDFTTSDWDQLYSLPKVLGSAIEYNGTWVKKPSGAGHTLQTEGVPWLFYITETNQLKGAKCNDLDNALVLASNVTQVSACRGYNSLTYADQDQGLVFAYVSGGRAYYRQILPASTSTGYTITAQVELDNTMTGVVSVTVHRLNDYRLGFLVNNGSIVKWYYTQRTYISESTASEQMSTRFNADRVLMSMTDPGILLYGRKSSFWGEDLYNWLVLFDGMINWPTEDPDDPSTIPSATMEIKYHNYYGVLQATDTPEDVWLSYSNNGVWVMLNNYAYQDYYKTTITINLTLPAHTYIETSNEGHGVELTQFAYTFTHVIEQPDPTTTIEVFSQQGELSMSNTTTALNIASRARVDAIINTQENLGIISTVTSSLISANPVTYTPNGGSETLATTINSISMSIASTQVGTDPI